MKIIVSEKDKVKLIPKEELDNAIVLIGRMVIDFFYKEKTPFIFNIRPYV